jgi:hypothetical protein
MVTRFDLIPGVLVALSALWLAQTPVRSGFALAIGTGIKVWPALMVPAFAAAKRTRIQLLASAFITSAVLISASIWIGGWARFISPLRYQSDRGLQVEAPISLPLMLAWAFRPGKWTVYYSDTSKSVEVGGPGANILLAVAGILTLLALALIAVLTLRAWRMGSTITADTIALIIVSAIGLIIMSNKVFSPQYLLWITPSVAVALALDSWKDAGDEKAAAPTDQGLQRITTLLLAVAALTQLIYPRCYDWVSQLNPLNPLGVTMLAVRDIALAIVVYSFCRRAWAATCLDQV